jgi:two-component system phosphate regulon sensor histidine kinase PhoR
MILICIVGISSYFYHFFNDSYIQSLDSQTAEQASMLSSASEPYFAGNTTGEIDTFVKSISGEIDNRITIIGADGTVLGDSLEDPSAMENHADRPEVAAALSGKTASIIRYSNTLGYDMLYTAVPVYASSEIVGCSRVAIPLTTIDSQLHHVLITIIWVSFLAALAAFVLALQLSKLTIDPVRKLTRMARRISEGDLNQEITTASRGEVGELATAFNLMAAKIKETVWLLGMDRDRISAIMSQMSDGIILVDAGNKISMINNAAKNIFKITDEVSAGRAFVETIRDYELDDMVKRSMQTKTQLTRMVETSRPRKTIMAIATPLENPPSCLLLLQDLTEIKRLETVRRDFISNVSHELRIPIASIKALAETLHEGAIDDTAVAKEFLSKINTETDRLAQLVQELGELSRLESGEANIRKSKFDIGELIGSAARRLKAQADRAGLQMNIDIKLTLPPVDADRGRMEQVLVNLLHNAIKFTPPGGSITVSASSDDSGVRISIADTGVGIPADDLPRVFERFYKADKARSGGGTGLGLAIAKHIIEAHGGKIWAESVEGRGAKFIFTLPYK